MDNKKPSAADEATVKQAEQEPIAKAAEDAQTSPETAETAGPSGAVGVPLEASQQANEPVLPTMVVASPHGLNLRAGPGKRYSKVAVLPDHTVVTLTGGSVELGDGKWLSVDVPGSVYAGWVNSTWLRE